MKKSAVLLLLLFLPVFARGDYVPQTVVRVADGAITQYYLVKESTTTNNRVVVFTTADASNLMTGIAQTAAAGAGSTLKILQLYGIKSNVVSDGTTTITRGDLIQPSTTVNGQVMKGTTQPVCTAQVSVAASAGTVFSCL